MTEQRRLQNIWAQTDKTAIDMMTKKTHQSSSELVANDSYDENSDLESVVSSCRSFAALPQEFRPPCVKSNHSNISQNQNKVIPSSQNTILVTTKTAAKTSPRVPLLETPKPDIRLPKHPETLHKCWQDANDTTIDCSNVNLKNNLTVIEKLSFQSPRKMTNDSFQNHGTILHKKELKHRNRKEKIRYEYVKKQEQGTVKFNFEMPPNPFTKDGLKFDAVKEENLKQQNKNSINKINKNFCDRVQRDFSKNVHTFYQENKIVWVSSLNQDGLSCNITGKLKQDYCGDEYTVSYKKNTVKWDSSLNLDDLNSDTEGKIEWTFIQGKKTIISTKNNDNNNHIQKQNHYKYLSTKPCTHNKVKNPQKFYRRSKKNKNLKQTNINHHENISKPDCKDTEKPFDKNDHLNNKFNDTEIQNSNTEKDCILDAENFNQPCTVNEKKCQKMNPSLSNNKPELTIKFNARKNINNLESNSFPEKIDNITSKNIEDQKKSILYYGREMSDFIIGSHTALSMFISMFNEWKHLRLELISYFECLEKNLKETSKRFTKYKDMLNFAKTGATLASAVPLPHISIAAKVIALLTNLFSAFLNKTEAAKAEAEDSNDISMAALNDTNASTELYMYGLQCGQQFEETAKLIENFHSNAGDPVIFESDSPEIATFIRGVLEYRPRHRIFYKKLHKCFQELLYHSTSEFSKRFCEPFLLHSAAAIDVVGFLDWRFRHEDFNGESVRFELEQIQCLIKDKNTSIKELAVRIQNCVRILQDELQYFERCIKDITLFNNSVQYGIKAL